MERKIDSKDLAIIGELLKDSKLSEKKLARKTSIPMTTVHNRLRKLRGLGVIRSYTVRLDHSKLGRPLTAYIAVKSAPGADQKELVSRMAQLPEVCEAAIVAAEFEIMLKARLAGLAGLNALVSERLRVMKGVADAKAIVGYEVLEIS